MSYMKPCLERTKTGHTWKCVMLVIPELRRQRQRNLYESEVRGQLALIASSRPVRVM